MAVTYTSGEPLNVMNLLLSERELCEDTRLWDIPHSTQSGWVNQGQSEEVGGGQRVVVALLGPANLKEGKRGDQGGRKRKEKKGWGEREKGEGEGRERGELE